MRTKGGDCELIPPNTTTAGKRLLALGGPLVAIRSNKDKWFAAQRTGGALDREVTYYNVITSLDVDGNVATTDNSWTAGMPTHTIHEIAHVFNQFISGAGEGDMTTASGLGGGKGFLETMRAPGDDSAGEVFADTFMGWAGGIGFEQASVSGEARK